MNIEPPSHYLKELIHFKSISLDPREDIFEYKYLLHAKLKKHFSDRFPIGYSEYHHSYIELFTYIRL